MSTDPVQASDDFDAMLASQVFAQRRYSRNTRRLIYFVGVVALFGAWVAVRVDRNSRAIDQTQAAIKVFCDQTNIDNRVARTKFIEQFSALAPDPKPLIQFADVAWPQHDCSHVSTTTELSTTTTIP